MKRVHVIFKISEEDIGKPFSGSCFVFYFLNNGSKEFRNLTLCASFILLDIYVLFESFLQW